MNFFRSLLLCMIAVMASACQSIDFFGGVSLHHQAADAPEVSNFDNPLGVIRMRYSTQMGNELFCEHVSSISRTEQGAGFNHCGYLMRLQ